MPKTIPFSQVCFFLFSLLILAQSGYTKRVWFIHKKDAQELTS